MAVCVHVLCNSIFVKKGAILPFPTVNEGHTLCSYVLEKMHYACSGGLLEVGALNLQGEGQKLETNR